MISNNAGGYSFAKSGANGRILRYVFNNFDQPGRYIYIRDNDSKDYWSASWQPVGKSLDTYKSECHHGISYTKIMADYSDIHTEALYYVPLNKTYEVWNLKVTNNGSEKRNLTLTGYAEFTNNSNYEQDQVNLQYSLFISRTSFVENRIRQTVHGNLDVLGAGETVDDKRPTDRIFGLAGADVSSYCGDKEVFIGRCNGYGNPDGVVNGDLGNALSYNENSCGALSTVVELMPGETKNIAFILGLKENDEAEAIMNSYTDPADVCEKELAELKTYWGEKFSHFQVQTPSKEFDSMINTCQIIHQKGKQGVFILFLQLFTSCHVLSPHFAQIITDLESRNMKRII